MQTPVRPIPGLWEKYIMAVDKVTERLQRIVRAFEQKGVPYALVGDQAVALWVATRYPAAVRTAKDVDVLLRRSDLPRARAAALAANLDYFETLGVGMFLEQRDPHPRHGVHIVWAGEKVRPENPLPAPNIDERVELEEGKQVVVLEGLVRMKLMANRDHDRAHLRDMIGVGLIDRASLAGLPKELHELLDRLLTEEG